MTKNSLLIFVFALLVAPMMAAAPRVHTYASPEAGIFANAYLVETDQSVVAIDATLLQSTSTALQQKLAAIGKPLRAVLITHGHPDHYNGVTQLIAGQDVAVIATAAVDHVIRENDAAKEKQWGPIFGAEWPSRRTFPNRLLKDGGQFSVDGVTFTVQELGAGESDADSYWVCNYDGGKIAFIGDVVLHGVHAYVSDGQTKAWLANLQRLTPVLREMGRLYPGHGESGGLELIAWQRNYLEAYRGAIADLGPAPLTEEKKKTLEERMLKFLPNDRLRFLIGLGADAVAREMAGK